MKADILINANDIIGHINPEIYGHFSEHLGRCIYEGIYVGEASDVPNTHGIRNDMIEAFKNIRVPVLRWPGGCFAEEYHWQDGVGPGSERRKLINTNWGGVVEDNSFGTHEYMELCRLVGCEPYINANVGSGTVREMSEWIEYMTSDTDSPMAKLRRANGQEEPWKLKYLGIGNENWGCGGNMQPEEYAHEYKKFQSFCKNYGDNRLYKIACGPSSADYDWMERLLQKLPCGLVDGIDLHYYTMPFWPDMDSATEFTDEEYEATIKAAYFADELITRHSQIMDRFDPEGKIGLVIGEWGCWHKVEPGTNPGFLYQQNTMRDAMVAAIELNIFNKHSKRVAMATLAQTVNVLQSVILTEGSRLVKTPTYHVFDLYKEHQGAEAVYSHANAPISVSASVKDDAMTVTMANPSLTDEAEITLSTFGRTFQRAAARVLMGNARDFNDFDHADRIAIENADVTIKDGTVRANLPACSVMELRLG